MKELEASIDQPWPVDKVIQRVREMKTHFSPGQRGCAKYTDTNHQILGLIIRRTYTCRFKQFVSRIGALSDVRI